MKGDISVGQSDCSNLTWNFTSPSRRMTSLHAFQWCCIFCSHPDSICSTRAASATECRGLEKPRNFFSCGMHLFPLVGLICPIIYGVEGLFLPIKLWLSILTSIHPMSVKIQLIHHNKLNPIPSYAILSRNNSGHDHERLGYCTISIYSVVTHHRRPYRN